MSISFKKTSGESNFDESISTPHGPRGSPVIKTRPFVLFLMVYTWGTCMGLVRNTRPTWWICSRCWKAVRMLWDISDNHGLYTHGEAAGLLSCRQVRHIPHVYFQAQALISEWLCGKGLEKKEHGLGISLPSLSSWQCVLLHLQMPRVASGGEFRASLFPLSINDSIPGL